LPPSLSRGLDLKPQRLLTRCLPTPKGVSAKIRDVPAFIGAPDTIRTCDLRLRGLAQTPTQPRKAVAVTGPIG